MFLFSRKSGDLSVKGLLKPIMQRESQIKVRNQKYSFNKHSHELRTGLMTCQRGYRDKEQIGQDWDTLFKIN